MCPMFPPRSVLAAVDFSQPSRVALAFAARLANTCAASLHVLHAEDPLLGAAAHARGVDLRHETREELEAFARSSATAGARSVFHVVEGLPVPVICDIASRERADLIVMASRGMSQSTQSPFGSITEGVLVRSAVSVLVVPATWVPAQPEGIDLSGSGPLVAALECTTPALSATRAACQLANALATSVHAMHVVAPLGVIDRWQAHADAACTQRVEDARRELSAVLPELHCEVPMELHIETGRVAETLAASAARFGRHAILVMGRRSLASRRGAPGDIARRVLTQTASPLLVHLPEE